MQKTSSQYHPPIDPISIHAMPRCLGGMLPLDPSADIFICSLDIDIHFMNLSQSHSTNRLCRTSEVLDYVDSLDTNSVHLVVQRQRAEGDIEWFRSIPLHVGAALLCTICMYILRVHTYGRSAPSGSMSKLFTICIDAGCNRRGHICPLSPNSMQTDQ